MSETVHLAIDLMGGDHGLRSSLPAALAALRRDPALSLTLFATPDQRPPASQFQAFGERLRWCDAASVVSMHDRPVQALRHKTDSSMRLALNSLAECRVDGVVSAGNTGALMAMGLYVVQTLAGIERPAVCSTLPTLDGFCHVLDLGANVDVSAAQLHQFAIMGSALAATLQASGRPRVALLNIGGEAIKGNEQVKQAAALLESDPALHFCGFIEGDGLYRGDADVVVCDGFVGNVALKVCEGTARLIGERLQRRFNRSWHSRLVGLIARPLLRDIQRELDPEQYNGALLLGLKGVVVKAHGGSGALGFQRALELAVNAVRAGLVPRIEQQMSAAQC